MVLINNNRTLVGGFKQPNAAEVVRGCGGRGDGDGGVAVGGDVGVVVARGGGWVRGSGRIEYTRSHDGDRSEKNRWKTFLGGDEVGPVGGCGWWPDDGGRRGGVAGKWGGRES
ncbi:hypothetical protein Tco_0354989, partial [Tanacetum coccineum]